MNKWEIDVAVMCIFFARPEPFAKSFEQVKKARPRVLLLWQDGPRENRPDDIENIRKCREIAEDIDWDCQVYRNYHDTNMGCDPSTFNSHQWAFSLVDKCIILEDDLVAEQSFFTFCKEMLDKYEHDERIDRICGTNILGIHEDTPYDYFFSTRGNSTGWASWRRVAETWNRNYEFLDDAYTARILADLNPDKKQQEAWLKKCRTHKEMGVPYWEDLIGARALLYHGLVIYPKRNMISNVGLDANSTHAPDRIELVAESARWSFYMRTYAMPSPCKAPPYIVEDTIFERKCKEFLHPTKASAIIKRNFNRLTSKIRSRSLLKTIGSRLRKH